MQIDPKNNKYLICFACGGLGNRLFTLCCTMRVAEIYDVKFGLFWKSDNECGCLYTDLFDSTDVVPLVNLAELFIYPGVEKYSCFISKRIKHFCKDLWDNYDIVINTWWDRVVTEHEENVNDNEIHKYFNKLKIKDSILKQVDDFGNMSDCIGVHVRRGEITWYKPALWRCIPLSKYYEYIDNNFPDEKLFIATDDTKVINEMKNKYGNRIFYHNSDLSRNTTASIVDSFIEMLILSKCKIILAGPSTFSYFASIIGKKPIIILNKQTTTVI